MSLIHRINHLFHFCKKIVKANNDEKFKKLVEIVIKLYINIHFTNDFSQLPSYVQFLYEILLKMQRLEDNETMVLTGECNTIILKKVPPKWKDLGSFFNSLWYRNNEIWEIHVRFGRKYESSAPVCIWHFDISKMKPTKTPLQ